ncbi:FAD-dependent monooxygenase [Streptomyces flaveolus]|uniref:FAD-dependent monooxygenase n=1 Tax=Streptomyces flaveolus TaxID=67297 RepID=UPI0033E5B928
MLLNDLGSLPARTDVLIAGGGPAGLALATELSSSGIDCVLVEPRTGASVQPGAKLTNLRTMELIRRWGLADALKTASELPKTVPSDVRYVTDMSGQLLGHIPDALHTGGIAAAPEPALWVSQYRLEEVLAARPLASPHCRVLRGARLSGFETTADGVVTEITDVNGATRTLSARWLAGCDGARSVVRSMLGIRLSGKGASAENLAIVFDSDDIDVFDRFGPGVHYWTVGLRPDGILGPVDGGRRWWMHLHGFPPGIRVEDLNLPDLMRGVLGREVSYEVLDVSTWRTHALLADRYLQGRVVLLGDAAHLHPPMGGYGMNMAIADAVDVGWKLTALLQGYGDADLLSTYEAERRPVHTFTIAEAVDNYRQLSALLSGLGPIDHEALRAPGTEGQQLRNTVGEAVLSVKRREFDSVGLQLGFSYSRSPIVARAADAPSPALEVESYTPTACPGHRLPHVWLPDGTAVVDHLDGFTLLRTARTPAARDGAAAFVEAARGLGVPLHVAELDDPALRAVCEADIVLVRPDTVVAWRGDAAHHDRAEEVLRLAVGRRDLCDGTVVAVAP